MKVVIADNMEESVVEGIKAVGEAVYKPADLPAALADADALVVRRATKVTRGLIAGSGKLRLVIRDGVGTDNIDKEACREKGIKVRNTPGASSNAVAELALGLIICGLRNIQRAHHQMKEGRWEKKALTGQEIQGRTLGIVGYGRIGSLLAQKARALGMETIAYNPPPRQDDGKIEFVEDLGRFLSRCDVVSLHVPALPETIGMINKDTIAKMKDGALLVNTSRGEVIDEKALYDACKGGKLHGAALDVYSSEPYKGPLLELENVFVSPHIAAATKEAQGRIGLEVIDILKQESR